MTRALIVGAGSYSQRKPGIRGIGTCLAERFAKEGFGVTFTYNRSKEGAERLERELGNYACPKPTALHFDARNQVEWRGLVEAAGVPDVFVYNAGTRSFKENPSEAEVEETFRVNYECPRFLTDAFGGKMKRGSSIVLVSSFLAGQQHTHLQAYCDSKARLNEYAERKAEELRGRDVKLAVVSPGFTRTPMLEERLQHYEQTSRVTEPEEVAAEIFDVASRPKNWEITQHFWP